MTGVFEERGKPLSSNESRRYGNLTRQTTGKESRRETDSRYRQASKRASISTDNAAKNVIPGEVVATRS